MKHEETISCENCIHYSVCVLWSTSDLVQDEAHKYCFGNFKKAADFASDDEVQRLKKMLEDKCDRCIERERANVAKDFIEAVDPMLDLVCHMTGLEITFFGKYGALKKKYQGGQSDG